MERFALVAYLNLMATLVPLSATEIVAHRGSSYAFPENTVLAAEEAWKEKADAVECDVYLTRDGSIVVMHDEDTKRTTGTKGLIVETDLADLQKLDAGAWKSADFSGTKIPTLDEFLATGPRFFVEIKCGPEIIPALQASLQRSEIPPEKVAVISFDYDVVAAAKRALPQHPVLWILSYEKKASQPAIEDVIAKAKAANLDGLDLSGRWPIDKEFVKKVKAAGLSLYVWTVDDPVAARQLAAAGVDGITTNRPGFLRGELAK